MLDTRFTGRPGRDDFADCRALTPTAVAPYDIPSTTWTWLHQVHGADVVVVTRPGEHAGASADAAVTTTPGVVLAIRTADCAPVVAFDPEHRVLGVAHAGWRGLVAGVLESMVAAMRDVGSRGRITASVEPHIRARCYEFGASDLDAAAACVGDVVRSETAWGTPALDVTSGIRSALADLGVTTSVAPGCTACEPDRFFSHRARADVGRHATVAWLS